MQYAEFEREIISERTRDKQVLARKRGKWTGGHLPLGYDLEASCLVLNAEEAARVRQIFEWYLEGQTVYGIVAKCADLGWHNKQWTTKDGKVYGGHPMCKCHVYKMLANPRPRADAKDSWDDVYWDVKALVGSATVAARGVAETSEAVGKAAPKLAESALGIGKSTDAIAADVHTATSDFVKPKTFWQRLKAWLEMAGKVGARFL